MKIRNMLIAGLLLITLSSLGCATTGHVDNLGQGSFPSDTQYICCAMGGSMMGGP